jgi:hypothetical protein
VQASGAAAYIAGERGLSTLRKHWLAYFGRTFFRNQETPAPVVDKAE